MNATPRSLSPSPKVQPWHLDREAIVYVRQSTPQQVLDHKESTARQYALADRAVALGWTLDRVTTIDADLGRSGQSIEGRPGFQRLLAEVALNRVGLILGLEMSRLARSCKDWHQLLELCGRFRVLLADADGVYDPTDHSDRLLLGLRGMMSEAELHVLKSRMYQGKLNKAKRGELIAAVPLGYLKHPSGQVTLDPDEQVRSIVRLVFDEFDRCGTVHGVLRHLIAREVRLPFRQTSGENAGQFEWRPPGRETIRQMLRHPIYAGAYRYGHRPFDPRRQQPGRPKTGRGSGRPAEECLVFLRDRFPAYITWDRFESNQQRMAANRSRAGSAGAVRQGSALLPGVVRCGRCGKRMYVRYTRSGRPSYGCTTARSDYGLPVCQSTTAEDIEAWVAEQVLAALQPAALEASLSAASAVEERRRQSDQQWHQRIERAKYDAGRAARQYHACEPENRLVARTLEQRWDELLREVTRLEAEFDRFTRTQPRPLGEADRDRVRQLAEQVPTLWHAATTTPAVRVEAVRWQPEPDEVVLTFSSELWMGFLGEPLDARKRRSARLRRPVVDAGIGCLHRRRLVMRGDRLQQVHGRLSLVGEPRRLLVRFRASADGDEVLEGVEEVQRRVVPTPEFGLSVLSPRTLLAQGRERLALRLVPLLGFLKSLLRGDQAVVDAHVPSLSFMTECRDSLLGRRRGRRRRLATRRG